MLHPVLAAPGRLLAYLASTLLFGLLLALLLARWAGEEVGRALAVGLPAGVLLGFAALTLWYTVRAVPRPANNLLWTLSALGGALVAGTVAWLGLTGLWATLLDRFSGSPGALALVREAWPLLILLGLLVHAIALLLHYLFVALERSREAERRALEAATLAREAELAALRSQLAPHFLFNCLNSIAALAGRDTEAVRRMCGLLAGFFRRSLAVGARELIPLGEELGLAATYLELEAVRFGDRLRVELDVPEQLREAHVPPLLLQPLVENAVHHGIAHLVDGGTVRIEAKRSGGRLLIEVANACDADRPSSKGGGVGLANVRSRLRALFDRRAALRVENEPQSFRARLELPWSDKG